MDVLQPVLDLLDDQNPGDLRGVYLYGSAVLGGLRPESDVDLLLLTKRSLTPDERSELVKLLLQASGWKGHADAIPDAAGRRPLEVTSLVIGDDRRWRTPPEHDFQYGEWHRRDILDGLRLEPTADPDVPILIATAHQAHRALRGPALDQVVRPVSAEVLRDSMLASLPDILEEIVGDERNTLLVLARIVATLNNGTIMPKDVAAAEVATTLSIAERQLMDRARASYLGQIDDDWVGLEERVTDLSHSLASHALRIARATNGT